MGVGVASLLFLLGCGDAGGGAGSASASATQASPKPAPTSKPSTAPTAEASAPPRDDCPKGSKGGGTPTQPCEATGVDARLMNVKWNGKMDDKGPFFNVENKSDAVVLYGEVQVYFYDTAGKQLDTKDGKRKVTCGSSNLFMGSLKPGEKALIQFACLKKSGVPDGTEQIEAEIDKIGFADKKDESKIDLYWRNEDLSPDERPKGGPKPAK
jgi:hypothetical protein